MHPHWQLYNVNEITCTYKTMSIFFTLTIMLSIIIVKILFMENPHNKKVVSKMFCLYCANNIWTSYGNSCCISSIGKVQLISSSILCIVHCRQCSYKQYVLLAHFVQYNTSSIIKSIVIACCLHSLHNGMNGGKKTSTRLSTSDLQCIFFIIEFFLVYYKNLKKQKNLVVKVILFQ
jgi:hypothetical protein